MNYIDDRVELDNTLHPSWGGSAFDSLIFQKAVGFGILGDEEKIFKERSTNILFNDALRLVLRFHTRFADLQAATKFDRKLESLLKENGFQYVIEFCKNKFPTYYGHHRKDAEVYIISEDMPSMKCINAVMKEGTNETEEEKDMLRKCLLIYETLFSGIYPLS